MRRPLWVSVILGVSGCSSGGAPETPAPPVEWTPGHYSLEALIATADGGSEELTGDLTVAEDGTMLLLSSMGSCRPPTEAELRRDAAARRRTFVCGEATYVIEPTSDRVRGEVRARVTEEYLEQMPCRPTQTPPCYRMRSRRVTRTADLTVYVLD